MHELRRQRDRRPAPERPHARDQLGELERLGEVVVGAELEALDAVADRAGRGQHQHPRLAVLGDEPAADQIAVHARQVTVEHDDVVGVQRDVCDRVGAVERDVDGHALGAQSFGQRPSETLVVFDDQHPHGSLQDRGLG